MLNKYLVSKSSVENFGEPDEEALSLIGNYTLTKPKKEDIFVFNVRLCDNETDRDFERFSIDSLNKLAVLFEGVTGIFDHSMKTENQTARVFKTAVITDESVKTSVGEPYTYLRASCYMLRSEKNAELIKEIENGIKKEVSVSCSVKEKICSVCGKAMNRSDCAHIPGESYSGKVCHAVLTEPTDAYEWSFVAVPAQRKAGVSKNMKKITSSGENPSFTLGDSASEIIKNAVSSKNSVTLTAEQIKAIEKHFASMSDDAENGRKKRTEDEKDIIALSAFTLPDMDTAALSAILKKLSGSEITMLKKAFENRSETLRIFEPKFSGANEKFLGGNDEFKI